MANAVSHLRCPTLQRVAYGAVGLLVLWLGPVESVSPSVWCEVVPMTGMASNLHPDLVIVMTKIETRLKRQLYVTSGYRHPEHNKDVGGVENSEHTYDPAQAVDVECTSGRDCWNIVTAALAEGINRVGIGRTFVHIGIAKDKPQNVIWHYYPKQKDGSKTT